MSSVPTKTIVAQCDFIRAPMVFQKAEGDDFDQRQAEPPATLDLARRMKRLRTVRGLGNGTSSAKRTSTKLRPKTATQGKK